MILFFILIYRKLLSKFDQKTDTISCISMDIKYHKYSEELEKNMKRWDNNFYFLIVQLNVLQMVSESRFQTYQAFSTSLILSPRFTKFQIDSENFYAASSRGFSFFSPFSFFHFDLWSMCLWTVANWYSLE